MKANELRVGNWVNRRVISKCGVELMLHRVTTGNISTAASDGEIDFLEPIPLTPEILPQLSGKFHLPIRIILGHVFFDYGNSYHLPKRLEYIHQFQNLYFALTGGELEYNPINETVQWK